MTQSEEIRVLARLESIDNSLKRLTERFCSRERVDVADEIRKRLIEQVEADLRIYEQVRDGKVVVVDLKDNSCQTYAEVMVDCILKTIRESQKLSQQSSPYPD